MHAVPRYIVLEVFVEFWNVHKIQRNIYQQICETGFASKRIAAFEANSSHSAMK